MTIRFPTAQELEQGFAAYEAEMQARRAHPLPPLPRDQDDRPPPSVTALVYCPHRGCGKRFDYATKGMALMQRTLHMKRAHADSAEAY
jgi:hypothetical protein